MKIGAVVFAGAMLAVGVVYETMGMNMPRGSLAYPGPGFFPTIIGAFLIVTALGCVLQEILSRNKPPQPGPLPLPGIDAAPGERHVGKTLQLIALMIGYGLLLKPLGFPLAIFAFVSIAIRIFGHRNWLAALAMSAVIAGVSYTAFVLWLKVALPVGVLEPILG